jgi:hypothetical protein
MITREYVLECAQTFMGYRKSDRVNIPDGDHPAEVLAGIMWQLIEQARAEYADAQSQKEQEVRSAGVRIWEWQGAGDNGSHRGDALPQADQAGEKKEEYLAGF